MSKNKKRTQKYSRKDWPTDWEGIEPSKFQQYRKYINKELPGYCGTYTAAALINYTIQEDRQTDIPMESLLKALKAVIDLNLPYKGTYPWDLTYGLNKLLKDDQTYKARWHILSDPIVKKELNSKKADPLPVIVGTNKLLGSRYLNHWVLAYQFGYNEEGKLFYRVYDNHGRTQAVIPASQTLAAVWLERIEGEI